MSVFILLDSSNLFGWISTWRPLWHDCICCGLWPSAHWRPEQRRTGELQTAFCSSPDVVAKSSSSSS